MAYITTGGSIPNDLPIGSSPPDVSFITTTGTDSDGTTEIPSSIGFVFSNSIPTTNFLTETAYLEIWNLMGLSNIWETLNKNWDSI